MEKHKTLNLTQQPSSRDYLKCLQARKGHKLISLDFSSLEPVILASASRDPHLLQIYSPNTPKQDIYLYTAAKIPGLGDEIRKYYDPDNPREADIRQAKKKCKRDRDVAKTVTLAANYNAGPRKIHETLMLSGFTIGLSEVFKIHREYWQLYEGVVEFKRSLEREWEQNKGYILNGMMRPICVPENYTKDLVNRYVQSSGHDGLMMYIARLQQLRQQRQINMYPWLFDFHDETIWEVPESDILKAAKAFEDALAWLNKYILTDIPIEGDVIVASNFAEIKLGDE